MDIVNVSYDKYLFTVGVMHPCMYASVVQNASLLLMLNVFVKQMKLPYECLAWSLVASIYIAGLTKIGISWSHPNVQRTMQAPDLGAFRSWSQFLRLGAPGMAMVCAEWWAFELLTVLAAGKGTDGIAAQTIIAQTSGVSFMVPLGMAISTSSLVGNTIGAGKVKTARALGTLALLTIFSIEICIGVVLHFFGRDYDRQFSRDPDVLDLAYAALPFLSLFVILDGTQCVAAGICRGLGKQYVGAISSFVCYYFFGLPVAYLLCYKLNFNVKGLLIGISTGTFLQCVAFMYLLFNQHRYMYRVVSGINKRVGSSDIRGPSFYGDGEAVQAKSSAPLVEEATESTGLLLT